VIARVNDPRSHPTDLLGIAPTVSATAASWPDRARSAGARDDPLLLELKKENLEIVEITIGAKDVWAARRSARLGCPKDRA
jgi:hypothetical protein